MKKTFFLLLSMFIMGFSMAQPALHWTPGNYLNNMTVVGVITIDGVEQQLTTLEVGAFYGDECRGSLCASLFPPTQQYIVTLTIGSDGTSGEVITFKLYDHATSQELDLNGTASVTFLSDDRIGVPGNWFQFSFVTPPQTFTLPITGYGTTAGGYYLIAPPFDGVNPDEIEGMTTGDYDLYYFDQAQDLEWINYKSGHFNLASGKGYLYAHKTDVTLTFTGMPYNGDGKVTLRKTGGLEFEGWNLVGNPYVTTATIDRDCYVMKADGSEIIAGESRSVAAMQGVFVIADADNEEMTFVANGTPEEGAKITLNILGNDRDNATIDRAIIRLGNEGLLPKCMLNPENTKVYIPQGGQDYAVVSTNSSEAELPVNFKANEDGVYTLSVDIKNAEMKSLHLIDNLTGANIDLLSQPTYSFTATSADSVNRFRLVFGKMTGVEEQCASGNDFAFVSNGEIMVSGTGYDELQVVDMTGRVVANYKDTTRSLSTSGMAKGVYLLRLIGSDSVKTQKIVVE